MDKIVLEEMAMAQKSSEDQNRGTGRTTEQLRNAPLGALFIHCNEDTMYPKTLAQSLNRADIIVVRPSDVINDGSLRGRAFTAIIEDHASTHRENWRYYDALQKLKAGPPPKFDRVDISTNAG